MTDAKSSDNPVTTLEELQAARRKIAELEARVTDLQFEPACLAANNLELQKAFEQEREARAVAEQKLAAAERFAASGWCSDGAPCGQEGCGRCGAAENEGA